MKSEFVIFYVTPNGGILALLSEDNQEIQDGIETIKGMQIQSFTQIIIGIIMGLLWY
jgi:hypothetical protein